MIWKRPKSTELRWHLPSTCSKTGLSKKLVSFIKFFKQRIIFNLNDSSCQNVWVYVMYVFNNINNIRLTTESFWIPCSSLSLHFSYTCYHHFHICACAFIISISKFCCCFILPHFDLYTQRFNFNSSELYWHNIIQFIYLLSS